MKSKVSRQSACKRRANIILSMRFVKKFRFHLSAYVENYMEKEWFLVDVFLFLEYILGLNSLTEKSNILLWEEFYLQNYKAYDAYNQNGSCLVFSIYI